MSKVFQQILQLLIFFVLFCFSKFILRLDYNQGIGLENHVNEKECEKYNYVFHWQNKMSGKLFTKIIGLKLYAILIMRFK